MRLLGLEPRTYGLGGGLKHAFRPCFPGEFLRVEPSRHASTISRFYDPNCGTSRPDGLETLLLHEGQILSDVAIDACDHRRVDVAHQIRQRNGVHAVFRPLANPRGPAVGCAGTFYGGVIGVGTSIHDLAEDDANRPGGIRTPDQGIMSPLL